MEQPIRSDDAWWHRAPDGTWMRYDEASGSWMPTSDAPATGEPAPTGGLIVPGSQSQDARGSGPRLRLPAGRMRIVAAVVAAALLAGGAGYGSITLLRSEPAGHAAEAGEDDPTKGKGKGKRSGSRKKKGKKSGENAKAAAPSTAKQAKQLKAAFIARADTICAKTNRRLRNLAAPTTPREVLEHIGSVRIAVRKLDERLGRLDPPPDDGRAWRRHLRLIGRSLNVLDRLVLAAGRGDLATAQKLESRLRDLGERFNRWARAYGFKDCSEDS